MTLLNSLLMNPVALTIAALVAKAALIVGIAAAVTQLMRWRRASAATQHLVWAASVVALIALPVLNHVQFRRIARALARDGAEKVHVALQTGS